MHCRIEFERLFGGSAIKQFYLCFKSPVVYVSPGPLALKNSFKSIEKTAYNRGPEAQGGLAEAGRRGQHERLVGPGQGALTNYRALQVGR